MEEPGKIKPQSFVEVPNMPLGFSVIAPLGEGAHGVVYKARSANLDRIVALKILKNEDSEEMKKQAERMKREAQTLAKLEHPNIVRLFQVGVNANSAPFLVCEYLEGESLQTILKRDGRLAPELIYLIFQQIINALQYAHENRIIHRDIKPSNIMISEDAGVYVAKLLDFGIAREIEEKDESSAAGLTRTTLLSGSPAYMSPEQCRGEVPGPASDFYSCACVIFECVFGEPPFLGDSELSTQYNKVHHSVAHLSPLLNKVSPAVRRLFDRALARNPERRLRSGEEFLKLLREAFAAHQPAVVARRFPIFPVLAFCFVSSLAICFYFAHTRKSAEVKLGIQQGSGVKFVSLEAQLLQLMKDFKDLPAQPEAKLLQKFKTREQLVFQEIESGPLTEKNRGLKFAAWILRARVIDILGPDLDDMKASIIRARQLIPTQSVKPYFESVYCDTAEMILALKRNDLEGQKVLLDRILRNRQLSEDEASSFLYLQIPAPLDRVLDTLNRRVDLYTYCAVNAYRMKDFERSLKYLDLLIPLGSNEGAYPSGVSPMYVMKAQVLKEAGRAKEAEKFIHEAVDSVMCDLGKSRGRRILQEQAMLRLAKWCYLEGNKKDCLDTMLRLKKLLHEHHEGDNIVSITDQVISELNGSGDVLMWKGKSVETEYLLGWI